MSKEEQIEKIFKKYPDIRVSEFKFLISDLAQEFSQQRQEIYKEIKKIAGKHSKFWLYDRETTLKKIDQILNNKKEE